MSTATQRDVSVSRVPAVCNRRGAGGWTGSCASSRTHQTAIANRRHGLAVLLVLLVSTAAVCACSVPVFRYALEKWSPDAYQAIVFHRGPLSEPQQVLVRDLTREGLAGRLHANVALQTVDLAQAPAPELLVLWQQLGQQALPWLVVRYPQASRLTDTVLSGPLTEATLKQAFDSPARKEISRRLGHGDSAVWVLLEIGDRQRDEETTKLIETRLNYLTTVLKLPAIEAQDVAAGLVTVPAGGLKLAFSVLRVSRRDPAETTFIQMLLGSEADLREIKEPILFPVFGRGRALYALAGQGIRHETIDEAATFLIGKCSCQVKELNPGVDLLLAADWGTLVKAPPNPAPDQLTSPPSGAAAPVSVTITGKTLAAPVAPPTSTHRLRAWWENYGLAGVGIGLSLLAALCWSRRNRDNAQ